MKLSACNGSKECPNGNDEAYCYTNPCTEGQQFYCRNANRCIPLEWVCDKANDCGDNSDEYKDVCAKKKIREKKCLSFQCGSGECVALHKVCDKIVDCADESDEGLNCGVLCEKFGCAQKCFQTPAGPQCSCKSGYNLSKDNKTCIDVNECELEICSQHCINSPGSFVCSCSEPAYSLRSDRISCKARGAPLMYIGATGTDLIVASNNLRHKQDLPLRTGRFRTIQSLDVGMQNNHIYLLMDSSELFRLSVINDSIVYHSSDQKYLSQITNFAYDWITDNVFYVNSHVSIMITNFNKSSGSTILYHTNNKYYIWALSLDPASGYMFWFESRIDLVAPSGMIKRAYCSGENVIPIHGPFPYGIRQLVIDSFGRHIYWMDLQQKIHRVNYDGTAGYTILQSDNYVQMFTFFESSLYWIFRNGMDFSIKKCKIHGLPPRKCEIINLNAKQIEYLSIFHENRQRRIPNPCANVACSDFCVTTPSGPVFLYNKEGTLSRKKTCDELKTLAIHGARFASYLSYFIILCLILGVTAIVYLQYYKPKSGILHRLYFRNPAYDVPSSSGVTHDFAEPGALFFENPMCQETNKLTENKSSIQNGGSLFLETVTEEFTESQNSWSTYESSKESLIPK